MGSDTALRALTAAGPARCTRDAKSISIINGTGLVSPTYQA